MFCHRYPTGACVFRKTILSGMLTGCEASGTTYLSPVRVAAKVQADAATASTKAVGGQDGVV